MVAFHVQSLVAFENLWQCIPPFWVALAVFCASRCYPTRELIILDIVKLTVFFWISSSSAFANCILQELIFGELPLIHILAQPRICLDWGRINIEKQLSLAPYGTPEGRGSI